MSGTVDEVVPGPCARESGARPGLISREQRTRRQKEAGILVSHVEKVTFKQGIVKSAKCRGSDDVFIPETL